MTWQKQARAVIAVFVVIFIGLVVYSLRHRKVPQGSAAIPERRDKDCVLENTQSGEYKTAKDGKVVFAVKFGAQCSYQDGRTRLGNGVHITFTRNGKPYTIESREADVTQSGDDLNTGHFVGAVKLTSEGTEITTDDATYDKPSGMLKAPGAVAFTRGRMNGTGVGATYDFNREVLWLLAKPHVTVSADEKGQGALDATAESIGLARIEHYLKLTRTAHITAEGRVIDADEITIHLTENNERVQLMELRGNSRITGSGESGGPQSMSARDIDLNYAEDGRTLQHSHLVANSVVQLPGQGTSAGKRIAGNTIDLAMSPDGKTVTNLNATENVQVDLPAEGDDPAKRIRSATLTATGPPEAGLQNATFGGNVDYRETRAARGNLPAIDRQARSITLIVGTKPGFGAIEQADFRGNVHFTDGPQVVADATHAIYHVDRDQIDLSPSEDPGPPAPRVGDGRMTVEARTIEFSLGSRKLKADTKVRSSMLPQQKPAGTDRGQTGVRPGSDPGQTRVRPGTDTGQATAKPAPSSGQPGQTTTHVPSILQQDQPVTVTSNRLEYDGAFGHAVYVGNSRLWQGATKVNGDTIIVDDNTGNLEARVNVHTEMMMDDVDPKTNERKSTKTTGDADTFLYDDAKRLATYTGKAHLVSAQGDLTGEKLELYLMKDTNELERIEAYGANGSVVFKDSSRVATGARLTYLEKDETYHMTGIPVEAIEIAPNDCKKSVGATLTFQRAVDTLTMKGPNLIRSVSQPIACPTETR
jgi:LPS export ABC transporter protein LptC/lipopolysaccharide transport protein LptA